MVGFSVLVESEVGLVLFLRESEESLMILVWFFDEPVDIVSISLV